MTDIYINIHIYATFKYCKFYKFLLNFYRNPMKAGKNSYGYIYPWALNICSQNAELKEKCLQSTALISLWHFFHLGLVCFNTASFIIQALIQAISFEIKIKM